MPSDAPTPGRGRITPSRERRETRLASEGSAGACDLVPALFPVLQALADLGARDPEHLGRAALVATGLLEGGVDGALLELGDREALLDLQVAAAEGRGPADERGIVEVALAQDHEARDLIAQLAHVAGPGAARQGREHALRDAPPRLAVLLLEAQEMLDQELDVLGAL